MSMHVFISQSAFDAFNFSQDSPDQVYFVSEKVVATGKRDIKLLTELSASHKKHINYEILDAILTFPKKQVGEKSVESWMQVNKGSLWYYHQFRLYFSVRNQVYELEEAIAHLPADNKVTIHHSFGDLAELTYYKGHHLKYTPAQPKKIKGVFLSKLHFIFTAKLRFFQGIWQLIRLSKLPMAIVDNREHYRPLFIPGKQVFERENNFFGYFYRKYQSKLLLLDTLLIPKFSEQPFRFSFRYLKNFGDRTRINEEYILLRAALNQNVRNKFRQVKNSFDRLDTLLSQSDSNEMETDRIIRANLRSLHRSSLFFAFKSLAFERFFMNARLEKVVTVDEYSPNYRAIMDGARGAGLTTVGIQHGSMHELHPGYRYATLTGEIDPFPDRMILWGEQWKHFLSEKGNFPEDRLMVAGQVRTDVIPAIQKMNPEVRGLPEDKFIALFASQPQRDEGLRKRAARDFFQACSTLPDVFPVVKVHPRETNLEYYRNIASEEGCREVLILKDTDLYLLLNKAGVVVTCFSTVGTETVYFGKPLIILDHLEQDVLGYIKDGVAFKATNSRELNALLDKLMIGAISVDKAAYDRYIKAYACRIDGGVSDRIWKFIDQE